jgi:hypothetical protein
LCLIISFSGENFFQIRDDAWNDKAVHGTRVHSRAGLPSPDGVFEIADLPSAFPGISDLPSAFPGIAESPIGSFRGTYARAAFLPHVQTIYSNWLDGEAPRKGKSWWCPNLIYLLEFGVLLAFSAISLYSPCGRDSTLTHTCDAIGWLDGSFLREIASNPLCISRADIASAS